MVTPIEVVYEAFLFRITDYSILDPNKSDDQIEEELFNYFKFARGRFYKCKKDLTTSVSEDNKVVILSELDEFEIDILVSYMIIAYISPLIITHDVLKQKLSDKDFRTTSQANQLRGLRDLSRELTKEVNILINEYTYMGFTDDK